jgi:hypothetical protein
MRRKASRGSWDGEAGMVGACHTFHVNTSLIFVVLGHLQG